MSLLLPAFFVSLLGPGLLEDRLEGSGFRRLRRWRTIVFSAFGFNARVLQREKEVWREEAIEIGTYSFL
jgi:hypothetical protein